MNRIFSERITQIRKIRHKFEKSIIPFYKTFKYFFLKTVYLQLVCMIPQSDLMDCHEILGDIYSHQFSKLA